MSIIDIQEDVGGRASFFEAAQFPTISSTRAGKYRPDGSEAFVAITIKSDHPMGHAKITPLDL